MAISQRSSSLPLILAGPILRRVTTDQVVVWLACSSEVALELRVYAENEQLISESGSIVTERKARLGQTSVQLGDYLWVILLEVHPANNQPTFPLDTLLSYNIYSTADNSPLDLTDVCLDGEIRPNFYIPSQLNLIAYGSCRKAHGLTLHDDDEIQDKDSLAVLAEQLTEYKRDLSQRPALLFLVGDQIYADDVLPDLMVFLQPLAVHLMGKDIALPITGCSSQTLVSQYSALKTTCGLTSSSKNAHVLSFGEYAALYLVSFGNRVGFSYDLNNDEVDRDVLTLNTYTSKRTAGFEKRSLHHFVLGQAQVRKTLANIPTIMNFDDHDITDDWNLCRSWYDKVRQSPDGTRIISNGIAAFWAFQGWGNDPAGFPTHFIQRITNHLHDPEDAQKAAAFDFHLWKFRQWGFVLPTNPCVIVVDSRTQRDFGKNNEPPQLMDRYALDWMRGEWLDTENKQQVPLIITGTPVCGFSSIEWMQYFFYGVNRVLGGFIRWFSASNLDMESWIANRRGFSFFMDTLLVRMRLKKVTILSGDVHYSFANNAVYLNETQPKTACELNCLQLTSSALRNTPSNWRFVEIFLANWSVKTRSGLCSPETLPWWERVFFWRFFLRKIWKLRVEGISGQLEQESTATKHDWKHWLIWRRLRIKDWHVDIRVNPHWITSRPNVALVYLQNGEVIKQVLLSGNNREHNLVYHVKNPDFR